VEEQNEPMLTHDSLKRDVARRIERIQAMMKEKDVNALVIVGQAQPGGIGAIRYITHAHIWGGATPTSGVERPMQSWELMTHIPGFRSGVHTRVSGAGMRQPHCRSESNRRMTSSPVPADLPKNTPVQISALAWSI